MAQTNEYLVELYNWIQSKDSSFIDRFTFDQFENRLDTDLDYQTNLYQWIAEKDKTFVERHPIERWTHRVKKKKESAEDLSSGVAELTDTEGDTSSSDSSVVTPYPIIEAEEDYADVDNPTRPSTFGDYTFDDINETEKMTIDGVEVDVPTTYGLNRNLVSGKSNQVLGQTMRDYTEAQESLREQESDPFEESIKLIQKNRDIQVRSDGSVVPQKGINQFYNILDLEEEIVVPEMNYHYNQYGFETVQTDALGDGMRVTAANGESLYVNLDRTYGQEKGAKELEAFLRKNKAESRKLKLQKEGYTPLQRKIQAERKTDAAITVLNTEANLFNRNVQDWVKLNAKLKTQDVIYKGATQAQLNDPQFKQDYDNYIAEKRGLNAAQLRLIQEDERLKSFGAQIDATMGQYTDYLRTQGELSGATVNAWLDGSARITAGQTNILMDLLVSSGFMNDDIADAKGIMGLAEDKYNIPSQWANFKGTKTYDEFIDLMANSKQNNPKGLSRDKYMSEFTREQWDKGGLWINGDLSDNDEAMYEEWKKQLPEGVFDELEDKLTDIQKKSLKYDSYGMDNSGKYIQKTAPLGTRYSTAAFNDYKKQNYGMIDEIRSGFRTVMGTEATKEYSDFQKEGFWGGAWYGLNESLPAMMGGSSPVGWAQRTAQMYSQVSDHLDEEMQDNPAFKDISENEKHMIKAPIGGVVAILEAVGLRNALKQTGLVNSILLRVIGKAKGRRVKGTSFNTLVKNEVDGMISRGVLTIGAYGAAEFETGFAQEIADISGKYVYNQLKDADMFTLPETLESAFYQSLRAGGQEMVGGWIMGVPGSMVSMASSKDFSQLDTGMFEVFENMAAGDMMMKSDEIYAIWLKNQVNVGNMTAKKAQEQQEIFTELKGVYSQIPNNYTTDQKKIALGLLLSKQRLETEIAGKDPNSIKNEQSQIDTIVEELEALSDKAYRQNQNAKTLDKEEEEEITEESAIDELKKEGVENPTPEQINAKLNELQKQKTKRMDGDQSTSDSSTLDETESESKSSPESNINNENTTETENENGIQTQEEIDEEASDFESMVDPEAETNSEIDSNPTKKTKVKDSNSQEQEIEVKEESSNLSFSESKNNRTKGKNSIVKQAKLAARAVKALFPSLKIIVHRDKESYTKLDKNDSKGFFQMSDNTIHINLSKAGGRTVAHEIFHAVLLNKLKFNDKRAQAVTKRMVQALVRSRSLSTEVKADLKLFLKNYDSDIKNEEKMAEIFGMIADNFMSLDAPTKSKIRKWIEAIAEKLGIEVGQSSQEVIDLLNTLAGKLQTGETITEGDLKGLDIYQELGTEGQVGSNINIRKQKGVKAPSVSIDNRPFAKHIRDKSLGDFAGQNFVTNMYDFTMSGLTELGNGLSMELYGGKNYVADMMEKAGKKIGDLSNLAAFNSESNAAGFVRNSLQGKAKLFIPHRGTNDNSWQYQQAIFEGIVNLSLDNNILTEQEIKDTFNETLTKTEKGKIVAAPAGVKNFDAFKKGIGKNIENFNDVSVKEIVEGLNIQNDYSPKLRKALNSKLASNKKLQNAIGVKSSPEFVNRLEDPSNKGSRDFDLIGITQFDPKTMVISKPNPGDIDYHPSFAYTIKAKIEGIFQPTTFYQSTEVTESYTKFGKGAAVTSVKKIIGKEKFDSGNVKSQAGGIPKVGTLSVRFQKSAKNLGLNYNMNLKGFMPSNIYNLSSLKKAAAELGLILTPAFIKEGYRKGELTGYYFKRNNRFYNPMNSVRKQKSINEVGAEANNIVDIIKIGRENNIKDITIVNYLKKIGTKMSEINPFMKISGYTLEKMPKVFGDISGGLRNGLRLFDEVVKFRTKLMDNNLTPVGKKIVAFTEKINEIKAQLADPKIINNKSKIKKLNDQITKIEIKRVKVQDKARLDGNKLYINTQSQIDEKVVEFLESTPEYKNESFENGFSTMQAQMIAQMKNAFYSGPLRDVSGRIAIAKRILAQRVVGRKELEEMKRDLRNFIRTALPNFVYSKPEVVKLVRSIADVNLDNIENKKAEILEFVNKKTNQSLLKKINDILSGKYEDISSGKKKAYKVDDDTRLRLVDIKNRIGKLSLKNATKLKKEGSDIEQEITDLESVTFQTPENRSDIADLNVVLDYLNSELGTDIDGTKTIALQGVVSNLNELIATGKTVLQAETYAKHLQYVADFEALYYDVTGKRIKTYIENPNFDEFELESNKNSRLIKNPEAVKALKLATIISQAKIDAKKKNALRIFRNLARGTREYIYRNSDLGTWMGIIGKMPGELVGNETQIRTQYKVDAGTREYKARKMATTLAINAKLENVYGKNWKKLSQKDSSLQPIGIFYGDSLDNLELNEMSQNQMAYLVAQYKDPANESSFAKKYGSDYIRIMSEMESKLNKNVKEMSRWQVEEFFPSLYQDYNDAYKKIYRTSMPWNQYYAGRIYREGRNTEQDIMQLVVDGKGGMDAFASGAAPASTKVRILNSNPIADMDQMGMLTSYVNDMNYFAAMGETINDMNKLFRNNDLRSQIEANFGTSAYKSVMNMITKIGNRGVSGEYNMEFINNITTSFVIGKLAINPTIYIKQLTSAPAFAAFIGVRNWTKIAAMNITKFRSEWTEIQKNSVYIQDRYGESILRTLETYSKKNVESVLPSGLTGNVIDIFMYLVKQGDKGAILAGGVPNYIFYKNQYRKANPQATEQEVIDFAIIGFERDTKQTQQSSDLQDKDEFQTGSPFVRGLNMFQTSIKQYFRQELMAAVNLYRKATTGNKQGKGTVWENTRRLMIFHSLLPLAFQFASSGLPGILAPWDDEDSEDLLRAGVLGNLNAIFLMGQLFTFAGDYFTGKPWTGQSSGSIPILELSAKFFADMTRADKYNTSPFDKNGKARKPEAVQKSIDGKANSQKKALYNLVNSLGVPTRQVERLINNSKKILNDDLTTAEILLYVLQFSEYVVESSEDRQNKNKKKKKATKMSIKDMKRYNPEAYMRYLQQQQAIKNSPRYREQQRLKDLQEMRRRQALDEYYSRQ